MIVKAAKQYNEVADGIEKHFEGVANQLRDWLPRTILPPPPPPPRKVIRLTYWQGLERWVLQHKKLAASIAAFVGTGAALLVLQKMNKLKKRRARRSGNGARTEVVGMPLNQRRRRAWEMATDCIYSARRIAYFTHDHCAGSRSRATRLHRLCHYA